MVLYLRGRSKLKDQNIKISLNLSGISEEKATQVLAKDSLGKNWVVKKRNYAEIALVEDHFVMYRSKYGEIIPNAKEILKLISSYNIDITSAPFAFEDIHSVQNLLEELRRNGAVCIQSLSPARIIPDKGKIFKDVKEKLTKTSLMQSMIIFEPLLIMYSTYYVQGDKNKLDSINLLVSNLMDGKSLDILLEGMKIVSNNHNAFSRLNYAREIGNASWKIGL